MSIFKLEVGGKCANGAVVLSLWCDDVDGVVLAHYHGEYVTCSLILQTNHLPQQVITLDTVTAMKTCTQMHWMKLKETLYQE